MDSVLPDAQTQAEAEAAAPIAEAPPTQTEAAPPAPPSPPPPPELAKPQAIEAPVLVAPRRPEPPVASGATPPALSAKPAAPSVKPGAPSAKPAVSSAKPVAPVAKPAAVRAAPSGSKRFVAALTEHSFQVAGVAVALGLGWIVGANMFDGAAQVRDMRSALNAEHVRLSALEARNVHVPTSAEVATLRQTVAELKAAVESRRGASSAAVTQLSQRVDKLDRDAASRLDKLQERADHLEKQASAPFATGSIPQAAAPAPTPEPRPALDAHASPEPKKPEIDRLRIPTNGYVLRDVHDGAALVESRAGSRLVEPGDMLPGAGRVLAIRRQAGRWILVTANGEIDSAGY